MTESLVSAVEQVPVGDLALYPGNPRQGDVAAIMTSLKENAQYRPLVVQKSTSQVLSGNHTLLAARRLGWGTVAVVYVDVDDDRARRIVLADNRLPDMGSYEDRLLADLLGEVDDLRGTGYTPDDVDDILARLEELPLLPGEGPGEYAAPPEVLASQQGRWDNAQPRAAFGVREAILILPQDAYEELQRLIAGVKRACRGEVTAGEAVLRGLRVTERVIGGCVMDGQCPWCS